MSLGHRLDGRRGYERALKLNPAQYVAANNLANLLLEWAIVTPDPSERRRILADATKAVERSLRTNAVYHHSHDNLGNIRLEQQDYLGALQSFQAALRFEPKYPEAENDIARVYLDARCAPPATAAGAGGHHLAALKMTDVSSERQRAKLCLRFIDCAASLRQARHLVEGFQDELPDGILCCCREEWIRRGLP